MKMTYKNTALLLLGVVLLIAVQPKGTVEASVINVGDYLRLYNGPGTDNGGEFAVRGNPTDLGSSANWNASAVDFHTFCVETSETISLGDTTYRVGGITMGTVLGGKALTRGAARLYEQFWHNTNKGLTSVGSTTIGGQSYALSGGSREDDARALQLALWHSMGLISDNTGSFSGQAGSAAVKTKAQAMIDHIKGIFGTGLVGYQSAVGAGETWVRVMNLRRYNTDGTYANVQDQLTVIPEPGSVMIWGLVGLAACLTGRKRREI